MTAPFKWRESIGTWPLVALSAFLTSVVAIVHLSAAADAAHDVATARALGFGFTGAWRALDGIVASLFQLLPLGTRALRGSLASTCCLAIVAVVLAQTARMRPRQNIFVALVATLLATLSAPMQIEATSPGGATLALLLILAPRAATGKPRTWIAFLLGLAFGYDPLVFLLALAAVSPYLRFSRNRLKIASVAIAFLGGALPLVLACFMKSSVGPSGHFSIASFGDHAGSGHPPFFFAVRELGVVPLGLATGGLALLISRRSWARPAISSLAVISIASIAILEGSALGPENYAAPALALLAEIALLSATGMNAVVSYIQQSRVPWPRATVALFVVMLFALPARQADDAAIVLAQKNGVPEQAFDALAFETLPLGTLVLLSNDALATRAMSLAAQGEMRGDLAVVQLNHAAARMDVTREPLLAPLLRDQSLYGSPEEWSLSELASSRPIALSFDRHWPRALARHLVPIGLLDRFFAEPRSPIDRKAASLAIEPAFQTLAATKPNADITGMMTALLRQRLLGAAAAGDRESIVLVSNDLHYFSVDDPIAVTIAKRVSASRTVDVSDLE